MRRSIIIALFGIVVLSSGCMGFFEGYGKQAQKMTSAEYTIGQYKDFLQLYNTIAARGSVAQQNQQALDEYLLMKGDPKGWSRSEDAAYSDLRFKLDGSINQYNALVGTYNQKAMDKTLDWLMIASLPQHIDSYEPTTVVTNDRRLDDALILEKIGLEATGGDK